MASEFTPVGSCKDTYGDEIIVERAADEETSVTFVRSTSGEHFGMILRPDQLAEFRALLARAAMPGQPAPCAYCEDDPDHEDPDNPGTCTCRSPGCGRGWCPQRDALAEAREAAEEAARAATPEAVGTHGPGCYCAACNAERREEALDAAEIAADRRERLDIDAPEANG